MVEREEVVEGKREGRRGEVFKQRGWSDRGREWRTGRDSPSNTGHWSALS